ncbi:molybdenum cofactor biosynthesis protein MoaE [Hyphobacterium sp. SN044]|uniref:molybdenum cofactor biosynthesis protein MoaE n=1 Tax=Hyphobacterium sp. SN044 TaxID=2912575 RepID=UPI001F21BE43|nr:molybdenum cofactor biosynthesis protein MoaE [Hyphobacterium sp. SN044]MCF8880652.1 molybdenum cofactor biosynthesis protein MoaE [Hyphobacterium sp. SN044]
MRIETRLTTETIDATRVLDRFTKAASGAGAVVSFTGIVRGGDGVTALELDHYPGMTEDSIETLAQETADRFRVSSLLAVHRTGYIPAGETVVFVAAAAEHRRAAFQAADCLMDRLKSEAAIWKREITADGGARRIEPHDKDHEDRRRWMEDDGGHR